VTGQPDWLLFDLNGTLLDPGEALPALADAITLAMALTFVGEYRDFGELQRAVFARHGVDAPSPRLFDDVAPGLERLSAAGSGLAVLTNSAAKDAQEKLAATGVADRFSHVIGTDAVGAFKPDARVYRHALEVVGCDPGAACMVAAHEWDLTGAANLGIRTAYLARDGRAPALHEPTWQAGSLAELLA